MTQQTQLSALEELLDLDDPAGPALPLTHAGNDAQVGAILKALSAGHTVVQAEDRAALQTTTNPIPSAAKIGGALALGVTVAAVIFGATQLPSPPDNTLIPPQPAATTPPVPSPVAPVAVRPTQATVAHDLLAAANRQRAARRYNQALHLYLRVPVAHPDSVSAHVALVAAADLQLEQFGRARVAHELYRKALAGHDDGPVSEEARQGMARAAKHLQTSKAGKLGASGAIE